MKAISQRLTDPCSFKTGLRFTQMHGVNGPEQLCEYLDLPLLSFKDTSESTEEQEIAEVSEDNSEGELEDPASAYGREGPAGPSSCRDQGKGVASPRLSKPPETSRVETPMDSAGVPAHPKAQTEATESLASDSVPTSGRVPRPSGRNPQEASLPRRTQPRSSEAEPPSGLGSHSAEATAYHGSASAPASAKATAEAKAEARGRRSEATAHLGLLAEAKGKKAEALPRRYPKLTFLDNRVPSREGSLPPDPQGAGTSARTHREPRGAISVVRSKVVHPRKVTPSQQDQDLEDSEDSEPDSPLDYGEEEDLEQEYEEPVSRPSKRHRQTSSSSSDHKKKKKKKRSKDSDKITLSQDQLATLIQQCMEAKISPSSEEDAAPPSYSKIWREFRNNIYLLHPDLPEPEAQRIPLRTAGGPAEFVSESVKLPLFPATASTLEACEDAILNPISKSGTVAEPLVVGSFLKPQRSFTTKLWDPAGLSSFTTPLRRNHTLPKELFTQSSLSKYANVTDKDLQQQEQDLREVLASWSALRWSFSGLSQLLDSDLDKDRAYAILRSLVSEQEVLAPVIEDRLTTMLTNTILRRRDMLLSSSAGKQLQEDNLVELRASPLEGPDLLNFPPELVTEERELKSSRALIAALKSSSRPATSYKKDWRPQSQAPSAAAGSAAQLPTPSTSTQVLPQQTQQGGAQPFPVSFKNRKSWAQTSTSWGRNRQGRSQSRGSSNTSYRGGRSSSRGRSTFRKGKQ